MMETERRKSHRFLVQDNVIAAIKNGSTGIGRVKDMSMEGLSFEHIYDEISNRESFKRNIFLFVNEICLPEVSCRVVYDIPASSPDEYPSCFIRFTTRRCGVKFEVLSEDQKTKLELFLNTYTQGTPP